VEKLIKDKGWWWAAKHHKTSKKYGELGKYVPPVLLEALKIYLNLLGRPAGTSLWHQDIIPGFADDLHKWQQVHSQVKTDATLLRKMMESLMGDKVAEGMGGHQGSFLE